MKYAEANAQPGAWLLPDNDVWNIPPDVDEVHFEIETTGYGWNLITSIRALVITCEFGDFSRPLNGRVFGVRTLSNPRESGYSHEGRVSLGGRKYRAFTSSRLFERADGSLVDVAVLFVCIPGGEQ